MNSLKQNLTEYVDRRMEQVTIDAQAKQVLYHKLTHQPKRQWWKMIVPMASLAVLSGIIFFAQRSPVTPTLLPQEALAAALDKTFTLESFNTTFGLTQSSDLHYRRFEHTSPGPNNTQEAITIDLWTHGDMMKKLEIDPTNPSHPNITLFNPTNDTICFSTTECDSLDTVRQQAKQMMFSDTAATGVFYTINQEQLIADVSLEPFVDNLNGPGLYINWSTTTPLTRAQMVYSDTFFNQSGGRAIVNYDSHGMQWYTNQLRDDGKYWHRMPLYNELDNLTGSLYVQILEVNNTDYFGSTTTSEATSSIDQTLKRGSMIYQVNFADQTIASVAPSAVQASIDDSVIAKTIIGSGYYQAIQPALYVMRHSTDLGEPSEIITTTVHNQTVQQYTYILPESFSSELRTIYSRPSSDQQYTLAIYLDETYSDFKGYDLQVNGATVESLWLEDSVLPTDQAVSIFSASF